MNDYEDRRFDIIKTIEKSCTETFGKLSPLDALYHKLSAFKIRLTKDMEEGMLRWEASIRKEIESNLVHKRKKYLSDGTLKTNALGENENE